MGELFTERQKDRNNSTLEWKIQKNVDTWLIFLAQFNIMHLVIIGVLNEPSESWMSPVSLEWAKWKANSSALSYEKAIWMLTTVLAITATAGGKQVKVDP